MRWYWLYSNRVALAIALFISMGSISCVVFSQELVAEALSVDELARINALGGPTIYGDLLTVEQRSKIEFMDMDSPPTPPLSMQRTCVDQMPMAAVMLTVPTTTWTYGCSATSAGMIFGYYDRGLYPNMYTGPCNNGVCPLTDLGQGINAPISGSCYIIATMNGFDGRTTKGHVADYWTGYGNSGPDPWEGSWSEHTWGLCTADYMGTSQWKWDTDQNGTREHNTDGATTLWSYGSATKLYDYVPPSGYGLPQTALCHGLRLFAESRGYVVSENFTQKIDTLFTGGFSFTDYCAEIDAGRPVMIGVVGHSMVGVGYNSPNTVYLHDTWDNSVHTMTWGGSYSGMAHELMTVIRLAPVAVVSPTGVTASDGTYNPYVQVAWNTVSGATHYQVYRASSAGGIKTTLGNWQVGDTYNDTDATPGVTYYYSVKAATDSSGSNASGFSLEDAGWIPLSYSALFVNSEYGMANPPVGTNSYTSGTNLTCSITNSPTEFQDAQSWKSCACIGWVGTGSVPISGTNTSVDITLDEDSTITWLWAIQDSAFSNQTINVTNVVTAQDSITAGDGYIIGSSGGVVFEAGNEIRLIPGFHAKTGSLFKAAIVQ